MWHAKAELQADSAGSCSSQKLRPTGLLHNVEYTIPLPWRVRFIVSFLFLRNTDVKGESFFYVYEKGQKDPGTEKLAVMQ